MKIIGNFRDHQGWFVGNVIGTKPLQVAYKSGRPEQVKGSHYHRATSECYIVLAGEATLHISKQVHRLKQGNVVLIDPKEVHSLTDQSPDFEVLMVLNKYVPNDTYDATTKK